MPTRDGAVIEHGSFHEDGVAFGGAEIRLEFLDPADSGKHGLLPTGHPCEMLHVPECEATPELRVTMINAGSPTVFVRADSLRLTGRELPDAINRDAKLLARLEAIRARAAVAMGLTKSPEDATRNRPATPKIVFVAAPAAYRSSGSNAGVDIDKHSIDVLARIVSMGKLHHAFTGTGSIALAVAAALPGASIAP